MYLIVFNWMVNGFIKCQLNSVNFFFKVGNSNNNNKS